MDLAKFFADGADAVGSQSQEFPAFPVSRSPSGNGQESEDKDISRISRISRCQTRNQGIGASRGVQARERAGAGGRARSYPQEVREIREQREMVGPPGSYISRSPSSKREIEKETGNPGPSEGIPLPEAAAFDERAAFLEYECGLSRVVAEAQARAEMRLPEAPPLGFAGGPDSSADAATTLVGPSPESGEGAGGSGVDSWRAALMRLDPHAPPCPGYRGDEWSRVLARALAFLDEFGDQAAALGWTASRLFGVHRQAGAVRVDACGALMVGPGANARAITADTISFGHLTYRTKPGQPEGVPVWGFRQ